MSKCPASGGRSEDSDVNGWARTAINFLAQLSGALIPAAAAVVAFPVLKTHLSPHAFATFVFLLTTASLMGLLDGGLGRSVTYFASKHLHSGQSVQALGALWAAMVVGAIFCAVLFSLLLLFRTQPSFLDWSGVDLHIVTGLLLFLPVFVAGSLLRGFLEAEQRFLAINVVQVAYGIVIAGAPLVGVHFTTRIDIYATVFGMARLGVAGVYLWLISRTQRLRQCNRRAVRAELPDVIRYARWLFVSNLLGVTIVYADRIAIGAYFTPELVSAYALPMELVLRGHIAVGALITVLFPIFVRVAVTESSRLIMAMFAAQFLFVGAILVASVLVYGLIPSLLHVWLGGVFSREASSIVIVSLLGLAPMGCTALAMAVMNAEGQTANAAALHVIELPLYMVALWFAASANMLLAIAAVWFGRQCFDMVGMQYILLRRHRQYWLLGAIQQACILAILAPYLFAVLPQSETESLKLVVFGGAGAVFMGFGIRRISRSLSPMGINGIRMNWVRREPPSL